MNTSASIRAILRDTNIFPASQRLGLSLIYPRVINHLTQEEIDAVADINKSIRAVILKPVDNRKIIRVSRDCYEFF